ncbi:hypothetical protein DFR70_105378 [Nocardia tenerifensis]|uniref:Uncharacterized protein n=1 Tax=Nocardia tenerifensis TaxID=228006 RepID=A0A318K6E0_9NOCA|nr:hypothetical protein DFR70_105378 [Nocardia tenerifensis]
MVLSNGLHRMFGMSERSERKLGTATCVVMAEPSASEAEA